MTSREQKLIARLKERVQDPSRASDEGLAEVYPPVKARAVAAAERDLGFRLPDLLRAIYTQVGNGGFGNRLEWGHRDPAESSAPTYKPTYKM